MLKYIAFVLFLTPIWGLPTVIFPKPLFNTNTVPIVEETSATTPVQDAKTTFTAAELNQNKNAKYEFATNVDDHISDLTHTRSEVRDGLSLHGSYSYSDGFTKRTVHYEADQNGYRIVGMEAETLDGPKVDLNGVASVSTVAHGRDLHYRVQSIPVPGPVAKVVDMI